VGRLDDGGDQDGRRDQLHLDDLDLRLMGDPTRTLRLAILAATLATLVGCAERPGPHPTGISLTVSPSGLLTSANGGLWCTPHTVVSGGTLAATYSDCPVRLDTSNSLDAGTATYSLTATPFNGEWHSACWMSWADASAVAPTVTSADGGATLVPFSGLASPAPGGLVGSTTVSTPGACWTGRWDGSEWVPQ